MNTYTTKIFQNNKKRGFTLAEVLCALAIVGICTVLMITTVKSPNSKAAKYMYINAYSSIEKAFYNSMIRGENPFLTNDDTIHTENNDTGAEILCRGLTDYINTKEENTCSSTKITSELANKFETKNIQFTSSNGMDFYISNLLGGEKGVENISFYIVYVDINGEKKPNSIVYTYKNGQQGDERYRIDPDIFAFALLETGRIAPIGIPEFDPNILTAGLAYFDVNGDVQYSKKSYPYYVAQGKAWGYYNEENNNPKITDFSLEEPLSTSAYIRSKINNKSLILKDILPYEKIDKEDSKIEDKPPFNCSPDDFVGCYIYLDLYKW